MDELSTPNDINLFFAAIFSTLVIELLSKSFIKPFQNFTSCIYILYLWFWKLLKWLPNFKSSNSQYTNFRAFMQIILNSDYIIYVKLLLSVDVIILYNNKSKFMNLNEIQCYDQQLFHNTLISLITKSLVKKWGGHYPAHYHMYRVALVNIHHWQVSFPQYLHFTIIQETIIVIRCIFTI